MCDISLVIKFHGIASERGSTLVERASIRSEGREGSNRTTGSMTPVHLSGLQKFRPRDGGALKFNLLRVRISLADTIH